MSNQSMAVLTTAYLGPIQYYSKFFKFDKLLIEQYDSYLKQTYRNRCYIYGANGVQILSIPVVKGSEHKIKVKDVRIDYAENWQKIHWKSIESAYRNTAYYEYYIDEIQPFYEKQFTYLLDFNLNLHEVVLRYLGLDTKVALTDDFIKDYGNEVTDYREMIHPKHKIKDPLFVPVEYYQAFADRYGFKANLSILDLLLNMGPEVVKVMREGIRTQL